MKLGIGIDTGGTYTDAVIYHFETQEILGSAKSLTTRDDLSRGILGALDQLDLELLRQAEVIALSTTLATNACVEDKGGRAKLIFFGGDSKIIDDHGWKYGLPKSEDILLPPCETNFYSEILKEPDWDNFRKDIRDRFQNLDGVGILELNAMRNGAVVEKKAKKIFQEEFQIPVVCGHELFSQLNSLQRGSSTLLNASLFPVIQSFLRAIHKALLARDIHAPLVIVRSDGSLMSEEFANQRPVETLLCGPAASTLGGSRLANRPNSIIIDMGGTTTDISLVRDGTPVTALDGVSIGKWRTFVDGLYVKTFGLGGDSAVHYDGEELRLEAYRIIPLCVAASQYPSIVENLRTMVENKRRHTRFLYEHYLLMQDISQNPRYTQEEKDFCRGLQNGPLPIAEAAAVIGKEVYTLQVDRLLHDGVVQLCGLTPTDIMHLTGDLTAYDREASLLGAEFVAFNLGVSVEQLCRMVYHEAKRKIYLNVVEVLLENQYPQYRRDGVSPEVEALINHSFEAACAGHPDPLLSMPIQTKFALVGLGAPIGVFLKDVAKLLGAEAVLPPHYQVANALGAVIGNVSASATAEILSQLNQDDLHCYTVYGPQKTGSFETLEEALAFAEADAGETARAEARRRGAVGELAVTSSVQHSNANIRGGTVYLGSTVSVQAVGAMGY